MDNYLKHLLTILPGEGTFNTNDGTNIITLRFEEVGNESKRMKQLMNYYKTISELFDYIKSKYHDTKMEVSGHDVVVTYN